MADDPIIPLTSVKWQLRIDGDAEDAELTKLVARAADWIERTYLVLLSERDVTETFDALDSLKLRAWPIAADADVDLEYLDAAGIPQPLVTYRLAASSRPARLLPAIGTSWPRISTATGSITAKFTAGYAVGELPAAIEQALLVLIGGYYADREGGEIAQAAEGAASTLLKRAGFKRWIL